jgi:hypothetical protein
VLYVWPDSDLATISPELEHTVIMNDYIFHIWFVIGFCHMLYVSVRIYSHFRTGYEYYFWLGLWVYKPSVLDEQGAKLRKIFLLAMAVYIVVGIFLVRS